MTLSRRGNVEPNLRISWISTVSPQTLSNDNHFLMMLVMMLMMLMLISISPPIRKSTWCPLSDTAETEERREEGLKQKVVFFF